MVAIMDPRWPQPTYILGEAHPPGTVSDDTQMSMALAHGLLDASSLDPEDVMPAVARRFVAWSRSEDNNRAPGTTCMTGCQALAEGIHWSQAAVADSKGCGSAMRVAPLGLLLWWSEERLLELSRASSLLTHGHPAAIEGAAAAALLVAGALRGSGPDELYTLVADRTRGRSHDFDAIWSRLPWARHRPPEEVLVKCALGESWVAEEAVASAFYCYARHPHSFRDVVLCAANTDGDSDSIACIAGGIAGAALGVELIPFEWLEQLEGADELRQLGKELFLRSEELRSSFAISR